MVRGQLGKYIYILLQYVQSYICMLLAGAHQQPLRRWSGMKPASPRCNSESSKALIAAPCCIVEVASVGNNIIFRSACVPQRQESVPRNNKALLSMGPLNGNGWNIVHGAPDAICALPEQATRKLLCCALALTLDVLRRAQCRTTA